jgi:hypothetical protein
MADEKPVEPIVIGPELIPAYVNDFLVTYFGDVFRLTLSETVYGVKDTMPRVAVVMSPRRAIEFAQSILKTYAGLASADPGLLALIKDGK